MRMDFTSVEYGGRLTVPLKHEARAGGSLAYPPPPAADDDGKEMAGDDRASRPTYGTAWDVPAAVQQEEERRLCVVTARPRPHGMPGGGQVVVDWARLAGEWARLAAKRGMVQETVPRPLDCGGTAWACEVCQAAGEGERGGGGGGRGGGGGVGLM